jgi:hypothetical protein
MALRKVVRFIVLGSLYVAVASVLLVVFMSWPGVYDGPANLPDMVDGTAERPYVGRLVLPALVRLTVSATEGLSDATGTEWLRRAIEQAGGFMRRRSHAPSDTFADVHTYGAYAVLALLCFIGFAVLLRALMRSVYPAYPPWVGDFAPIMAMVATPLIFFRYVSFVYDPMTLLVFALCLWLIAKRALTAYLLLFPVAVLSRETAILLFGVLAVREWGSVPRARLARLGLYHVAVFVALRVAVGLVFRGNPGTAAKFQVHVNLDVASHAAFYVKTFLPLAPLALLVVSGWREKPAFVRNAFLVLGAPLVILCLLFGSLGEMRTYYEVWPLAFLLAVPSVARAFGWDTPAHGGPRAERPSSAASLPGPPAR